MIGTFLSVCEALIAAALFLVWVAIEVIGYGGLVFYIAAKWRWITFTAPPRPPRDHRWGTSVRAAGLSARRQQPA